MITTQDGLINGLGMANVLTVERESITTAAGAGLFCSSWRGIGMPTQGAIPTTFATCTHLLTGAMELTKHTGDTYNQLSKWSLTGTNAGIVDNKVYYNLSFTSGDGEWTITIEVYTAPSSGTLLCTGQYDSVVGYASGTITLSAYSGSGVSGSVYVTIGNNTDYALSSSRYVYFNTTSAKQYVGRVELTSSIAGTYWLVDRLVHMGGMSGTATSEQLTNPTGMTLTDAYNAGRCLEDGSDVDWFLEIYTDIGSSASNATVKYKDQSNTTRTCTVLSAMASATAGRLYQVTPLAGYYIKNAFSVTLSATTGTAGNFGVTGYRRLVCVSIPVANQMVVVDFAGTGLAEVKDNACLQFIKMDSTTTAGAYRATVKLIRG